MMNQINKDRMNHMLETKPLFSIFVVITYLQNFVSVVIIITLFYLYTAYPLIVPGALQYYYKKRL